MAARAILFDLDGTLVDSESLTDAAIERVMRRRGQPGVTLPPYRTRGRTWQDIAAALGAPEVAAELLADWEQGIDGVEPLPGAVRALADAAAAGLRVAIVSSSPRHVVRRFAARLGAPDILVIGGDDVACPKPAPDAFLLAAARLDVAPAACVVFEDSRAGLEAARAAGMASVAVLRCSAEPESCSALAGSSCHDFDTLPPSYWSSLAR